MIYMSDNVPLNTVVWACAYSTNDSEKSMALRKKPVQGIVTPTENNFRWRSKEFTELKKNGELKKSSRVYADSRRYADTYEECVELYNSLVNNQINRLKALIAKCEEDLIC